MAASADFREGVTAFLEKRAAELRRRDDARCDGAIGARAMGAQQIAAA